VPPLAEAPGFGQEVACHPLNQGEGLRVFN
jgi:hypothetical protein